MADYIEYLNNDENPVIMSALENVLLSKAKKKSEKFLEVFKKQVSLIIKQFSEPISSKLPIETNEIYRDFYQISDDILQKFSESLNDNLTSKQLGDRILILMNKMRDELENILETNTNYFDELYQDAYDEIVRAIDNKTVRVDKIRSLKSKILMVSCWDSFLIGKSKWKSSLSSLRVTTRVCVSNENRFLCNEDFDH